VLGKMAFGEGADLRRDTIFRIASMTKAITATAVMMLVEEGKFRRDEPVDRLLPELAERRVLRRLDADVDDTVPAKRPITIEDLLTFRCGLGIILAPPGRYPIQKAIADLGINGVGFGPPDPAMPLDGDGWMRKIGSLPLLAQPGEDWLYTAGSNIQGVLVARASGQPLSRFFEERIFGPLGMKDTTFFVPPSKIDRLVHAYRSQDGGLIVSDEPVSGKWSRPPTFEQGDAGLVSTVDDYLAFARMLLADGRHRGQTLLTADSVKAMKTNHLTAPQRAGGEMILGRGRGWGYGMSVVTDTIPGQPAWLTSVVMGLVCWCAPVCLVNTAPAASFTFVRHTDCTAVSFLGQPRRTSALINWRPDWRKIRNRLTVLPLGIVRRHQGRRSASRPRSARHAYSFVDEQDFISLCRKWCDSLQTTEVVEVQVRDIEELLQLRHDGRKAIRLVNAMQLDRQLIDLLENGVRGPEQAVPFRSFDIHLDDQPFGAIAILCELILGGVKQAAVDRAPFSCHAFPMKNGLAARAAGLLEIEAVVLVYRDGEAVRDVAAPLVVAGDAIGVGRLHSPQ
jgi:CubicO group peptidase (beta-lactamase class C family)